jgi:hypothetical protein
LSCSSTTRSSAPRASSSALIWWPLRRRSQPSRPRGRAMERPSLRCSRSLGS